MTEVDGRGLASTSSGCEVRCSFNGDESAMVVSLRGMRPRSLKPCPFAPELSDVSVTSGATALANADGALSVQVTEHAHSHRIVRHQWKRDQSFPLPGDVDGVLAGYYNVTALDADDCEARRSR